MILRSYRYVLDVHVQAEAEVIERDLLDLAIHAFGNPCSDDEPRIACREVLVPGDGTVQISVVSGAERCFMQILGVSGDPGNGQWIADRVRDLVGAAMRLLASTTLLADDDDMELH